MGFSRLRYWRRLFDNYVLRKRSHLAFWHERPARNPDTVPGHLGPYYMTFADKAGYAGPFDADGVPILDYGGDIGPQHNPIAIAQYGLANYNLLARGDPRGRERLVCQADWLVENLEPNAHGLHVWMHKFDWEYGSSGLRNPWYSGLAQGQGVSCLLRAHAVTGNPAYRQAAVRAFAPMRRTVAEGGVLFREGQDVWIEEYLTSPPSHVLNGFLWALWGVHDMALVGEPGAHSLWDACVATVAKDLRKFDTGYWSLYDLLPARGRCVASPFYHRLHIVQLDVMAHLTDRPEFARVRDQWQAYLDSPWKARRAVATKAVFKVLNY